VGEGSTSASISGHASFDLDQRAKKYGMTEAIYVRTRRVASTSVRDCTSRDGVMRPLQPESSS
jgi:hypothetical protein